ncbi:MAG: penicillin-binding protein 2 [Anaerolineae bacterium]|nr:penicillin-binding protein 2 [Anaerolineae bacterium]
MSNLQSRISNLKYSRITLLVMLFLLISCNGTPTPTITPTPTPIPVFPPTPTPLPPTPDATAATFLNAWKAGDYAEMYARLSPESQSAIDIDGFTQRYQNALRNATVLTVTTRLQSALQEEDRAQVAFHLELDTALVSTLITDTIMTLSLHDGQWRVDWDEGLIWPQLTGGHYFRMDYSTPIRANIYDRNGLALAAEGTIVTVGVIPGQIEDERAVLETLALVTGLATEEIHSKYAGAPAEWKVAIADVSAEVSVDYNDSLSIPGIYRDEKDGRIYPHDGVAPHVVGWVSPVPAEQLDAYRARGYQGDEWVGVSGLEASEEEILAGKHGGRLLVVDAAGEEIAVIAESPATPSRAIYTTIDREFQAQVEQILGGRRGAIVVLNANTGEVLAMASGPGFNSNAFVGPTGGNERVRIVTDPRRVLFNRATQGTYPLGSVFKITTMSAAVEEGGMHPQNTSFHCPGFWEELGPAYRKGCWKEDGHGDITLQDGLTASCDVVFYSVGKRLDETNPEMLPRFARAFGFGEPTGIEGVLEEKGLVPDPSWKVNAVGEVWWVGDTVNLAIGQGYLLVTPLQVARMIAAVGNGGTLYRPYVIRSLGPAGDTLPEQVTTPEIIGTLPVSPQNLQAIQEALLGVTTKSIGTAWHRYTGLSIPVAGKTGTAEVGGPDTMPHSWFAAYAPANDPEIAIAIIVENAGEGSTVAAPMTRQVIEAYYGLPLTPLPPQAEEGYVPPTPTPQP